MRVPYQLLTVAFRGMLRSLQSEHGLLPMIEITNVLRRGREDRTAAPQEIRPGAKRKLQDGASQPGPASQSQPSLCPPQPTSPRSVERKTPWKTASAARTVLRLPASSQGPSSLPRAQQEVNASWAHPLKASCCLCS